MKEMIVGTFNKIPKKFNSHSYGWARTWSENTGLAIDFTNTETLDIAYLLHGANFGGALNLFGGFTAELENSINTLLEAKEIISLEIPMPDYGAMLKKRNDVTDKEWCDHVSERLADSKVLVSSNLPFTHLAIGDSHTAAYAPEKCSVVKQDGTTLFGQIKTDFEYIRSHIKPHHKSLTLSLGNIDIRHHAHRLDADIESMVDALHAFGQSTGMPVEYAVPWPIEFEGRKLPKTGYYKGTPFSGSIAHRRDFVRRWIVRMHHNKMQPVHCPMEWYTMDPEQYAKYYMEARQSVHLSPEYYRRTNWGRKGSLDDFFGM